MLELVLFLALSLIGMSLNISNYSTVLIALYLAILSYWSKSIAIALSHFLIALVVIATIHLALYRIIGDSGINPIALLAITLGLTTLLTVFTRRSKAYNPTRISRVWQEAILLVSSSLLILRWPVNSIGKSMTILKPEDNARWLSFAAELLPFRQGLIHPSAAVGGGAGGGHVFDYYIAIVHSLTNLFLKERSSDLSSSYITIINTYRFTILLLLFFSSLLVFHLIAKFTHLTLALLSAIFVPLFMYPAFYDIVLRTGHLSLLVAMLFLLATLVFTLALGTDITSNNTEHILVAVIGFGIGGIWWPALPISLGIAITSAFIILYKAKIYYKPFLLLSVALSIALTWIFMSVYFVQYFEIISIRSFLTAKGGVQEVSNLILGCSLISFVYICVKIKDTIVHKMKVTIWIFPVGTLTFYAVSLLIASYFTGPEFSPNYSAKKVMFLLYLTAVPFLYSGLIIAVSTHSKKQFSLLSPLIAVGLAINFFGLDINNPRQIPELAWGPGLEGIIQNDPRAVVLCSSSESNSYDAYVCTRHAKSILATGNWLTKAWQDYLLTPTIGSIEKSMSEIYAEFRLESSTSRIYLVSLESKFIIAQQNKWWMESLPWSEIVVVDGHTGNVIPNSSVNN